MQDAFGSAVIGKKDSYTGEGHRVNRNSSDLESSMQTKASSPDECSVKATSAPVVTSTPGSGGGDPNNQKRPLPPPAVTGKKRPYRRTKRPKNYCDKSTVTTTTPAAETPINVYDAVLEEAEDLLTAAAEAQALGRLKMASAYQLLLHARLVGLGKRFDRAQVQQSKAELSQTTSTSPMRPLLLEENEQTENGETKISELVQFLPSNIEMDQAMMEHLARAAAELHHQRTGRKKSSDGLLASSPASQDVFSSSAVTVAWTKEEHTKIQNALKETSDPAVIAKMMESRNEAQVRAYMRNMSEREKGAAAIEKEILDDTPRKRGGRGRKPPTTAINTVPNANLDARTLLKGKALL